MTLRQFPPELLATILNYLPEYEVKTASDVNTKWRTIASELVLAPRGHLLLNHPPQGVWKTLFHTIHVDGVQQIPQITDKHKHHLTNVTTVVLYGPWTRQKLRRLSEFLKFLPNFTSLELSQASPPIFVLDFLLFHHEFTTVRCSLEEKQFKSYRKICERFRTVHGLFEEVVITQQTRKGVEIYVPKTTSLKYPKMELTTSLTVHPARLPKSDYNQICKLSKLEHLTVNYPKNVPENFLTNLPPRLKRLNFHNAKTVSHDSWTKFFQSSVVDSLEELCISGQNQIDSSIFDNLEKNQNLRKLYLQMHCPCYADQCGVKSMLTWCSNIEILVLYVSYSSVGVADLLSINKDDLKKLHTLKILFQLTSDMIEPYKRCFGDKIEQLQQKLREKLPRVLVKIQFKTHLSEFLCGDDDDN